MAAHQYWRLTGFLTESNVLELSQAQLYDGATLIAQAPTFTVPPTTGTAFPDVLRWDDCTMSGFALVWNLSTPVEAPRLRLGAGSNADNFPRELYCQYSDDGKFWSTSDSPVNIEFPGAGQITTAAVPVTDPKFASVALLLHGDGVEGSTAIIDSSSEPKTPLNRIGIAVSATMGRFSQSLFSSGSEPAILLYDWVSTMHLNADFEIAFWLYPTGPSSYKQDRLLNMGGGINIAWPSYQIAYDHTSEIPYLNFFASATNAGITVGAETGVAGRIGAPVMNAWNYVCVRRIGNVWEGRLNNIPGFYATSSAAPYNSSPRGLQVGGRYDYAWNSGSPTVPMAGYMSELRITNGAVREFVLPTAPFGDPNERPAFIPSSITPAAKRWRTSASVAELIVGGGMPDFNLSEFAPQEAFFDAYNGGIGIVYGTVKEKGTPANTPLRRRVVLIDERSRIAIRETWSDAATGNYEFRGIKEGVPYTVLSYDHPHNYRATVADNLFAEVLP